tara:strand:+ start:1296 stop:1673 length:378 start_codon:yes stop_codon:yes gene_type:complete
MKVQKKNRKFKNKSKLNQQIIESAIITLRNNEQISLSEKVGRSKKEYDIVKKNWGYYVTPSINKRLKFFKYECALVRNNKNKFYICMTNKEKKKSFLNYLKKDNQKIIFWFNENNLKNISKFFKK